MTNQEQLDRMVYYTNGKNNVYVFEHGTCVAGILPTAGAAGAKKILARFDVPFDGEGSEYGDFEYLTMDDGNYLISFWELYVCVVKSAAELGKPPTNLIPTSKTEVLAAPIQSFGGLAYQVQHGLLARHYRGLDARGLNIVLKHELPVLS